MGLGRANGAGKSTLAVRFVKEQLSIVNPDVIAARLSSYLAASSAGREAGQQALEERQRYIDNKYIDNKQSFVFETTLSGFSELKAMRRARDEGYKVNLVFTGMDRPECSIRRIGERVSQGGHDVPAKVVRRRYERSFEALPKAMAWADRVILFDNSTRAQRMVAVYEKRKRLWRGDKMPGWARKALQRNK